jgi:hypothetical protein
MDWIHQGTRKRRKLGMLGTTEGCKKMEKGKTTSLKTIWNILMKRKMIE